MGAGRAGRARRGAVLGTVLELCPTEKEGWGTPRTALRNLLNLSLTLDPPSSLLDPPAHPLERNTLLLSLLPRTRLLHSRSCSRFTDCSSCSFIPASGAAPGFLPLWTTRPAFVALPGWSCCCSCSAASIYLHCTVICTIWEGGKNGPSWPSSQSPSNLSRCSSEQKKEAKNEQVGQMCSKRGFVFPKSPSFVMSRARARQKLRETCSNHRGHQLQRCSHSGPWRFRPVATNDLLRICTLASCPLLWYSCTVSRGKHAHILDILGFYPNIGAVIPASGRPVEPHLDPNCREGGSVQMFRIICPVSVLPFPIPSFLLRFLYHHHLRSSGGWVCRDCVSVCAHFTHLR